MNNSTITPEIWETEEEKTLSIGKLKHYYLQITKKNYQGKVIINKNTMKPIRISKDGIMEWWRKSRKREHIISVQLLGFFLENAIFTDESPDYKKRPEIECATRFESACKINDKLFKVIITVRKSVGDISKFKYYTLKSIEFLI